MSFQRCFSTTHAPLRCCIGGAGQGRDGLSYVATVGVGLVHFPLYI